VSAVLAPHRRTERQGHRHGPFGASAPAKDLFTEFGFTTEAVVAAVRSDLVGDANPKFEYRNPKQAKHEARNSKRKTSDWFSCRVFGFVSDFVLRISHFMPIRWLHAAWHSTISGEK
jgi:hypothetical protein